MNLGRIKLAVFLSVAAVLAVALTVLFPACLNLVNEPAGLSTGTSPDTPVLPRVPPPGIPVQLVSRSAVHDHHVFFTYYDGSAMQTWAIKTVTYPDTTLKDFPGENPALPGQVFVRWIYADTSTDPISYPEFTASTNVVGDIEVRAYHHALPTLVYDPNGAGGMAPASVSVLKAGETVGLAGQGDMLAPAGTVFSGWYMQEWTGSAYVQSGQYQAGDLYQLDCSATLYARWDPLP